MDKIKTQDVWIPKDANEPLYWLEKKSNMIVLTPEQLEEIIEDARKDVRIRFVEAYERAKKLNEELKWD